MKPTRWVKKQNDGTVEEASKSPRYSTSVYENLGYVRVPVELYHVPAHRLGIEDGGVVELPEPEPTTEIVNKNDIITALMLLVPEEALASTAVQKTVHAGVARLTTNLAPGDEFDLKNPLVPAWLEPLGLTVDQLRQALQAVVAT